MVVCAICISIAAVLSMIKVFALPFGGDITLASMMPIIIVSFAFGTKWGLTAGFVYSIIQLLLGFSVVSALVAPADGEAISLWRVFAICACDYFAAYTLIGLSGVFKGKIKNDTVSVCVGSIFALMLRYAAHIISGAIFFGSWAEWFFNQEGFYSVGKVILNNFSGFGLSFIYSVFYNGLYMIPEIIITAIATPVIYRILTKAKVL